MLIEAKNHGDVRTTDRTRTSYTYKVGRDAGLDAWPNNAACEFRSVQFSSAYERGLSFEIKLMHVRLSTGDYKKGTAHATRNLATEYTDRSIATWVASLLRR